MELSQDIFFYIHERKLILWNYKNHEQFEIDLEHLKQILNFSNQQEISNEYINLFRDTGVIVDSNTPEWHWDILSRMFHVGTKNIPISENKDATPREWVKEYLEYCEEIGDPPEHKFKPIRSIDLPVVIEDKFKKFHSMRVYINEKRVENFSTNL